MNESTSSNIHDTKLLLLGITLGAGLAALFAPRSGADMRKHIKDTFDNGKERAKDSAGSFADEAKERIEEARDDIGIPDRLAKRDLLEEGLGE